MMNSGPPPSYGNAESRAGSAPPMPSANRSMSSFSEARSGRPWGANRAKLSRQEDSYLHLAREDHTRSLREDLDKAAGTSGRGDGPAEEGIEPSMPGAEALRVE